MNLLIASSNQRLSLVKLSQVTFTYIALPLHTIQIVLKELYSNKHENNRINDANFVKFETHLNSAVKQFFKDNGVIIQLKFNVDSFKFISVCLSAIL